MLLGKRNLQSKSEVVLRNVVMAFMVKKGVKHKPVDINELNLEFGADNIKKLIVKQYLIKTKKGVTVGL